MIRMTSPILGVFLAVTWQIGLAEAAGDTCLMAARSASDETGVPYDVLAAIALTESGRSRDGRFKPWPWTINAAGAGSFHDDLASAKRAARQHLDAGTRSVDIGCFQVNIRWHGEAFDSLDHMFDPLENARYAARFLAGLAEEFGDWTRAAGAYHSRTEEHAARYRKLFASNLRRVDPEAGPVPSSPSYAAREAEDRPVLVAAAPIGAGSLYADPGAVPMFDGDAGPLFLAEARSWD